MARQTSFIKLEGTIGDLTFYKGANGSFARQKGGIAKSRILSDPEFQRTRENLAEFARAAGASRLLKDAFRDITLRSRDLRTHNRLYAMAMKVIKSDSASNRGERDFALGNHSLMTEFQFNINAPWIATVFAKYQQEVSPTELTLTFEEFIPAVKVSKPTGATHARFFLVGTALNIAEASHQTATIVSADIELVHQPLAGFTLSIPRVIVPDTIQVYALGVEYMQEVNGSLYALNDRSHNSAKIILTS